ncbi:MAG TPA: CDP-alcohol phosphatidyltransferase family protein [Beutenbergiaceae bacterium]|nr:CDP-alcohol phosphatidyltransferase family protein [Beutenbergiaceae bacterium]
MSPNAVSAISFAFSLAGIAILAAAPPTASTAVIATGILALGYVLDSADGQLARLTGTGSAAGEWLDHVLDAGRIPLFHIGVAVSFLLRPDSEALWQSSVALAFAVVGSMRFFAHILSDKLTPKNYSKDSRAPAWQSFAKLPLDVGFVYLAVLALPKVDLFSGVYTALFVVTALTTIASLRRKYIGLKSL